MRSDYKIVDFAFDNLPGWEIGEPTRGILHTDGNPKPHTALGALRWGNRERAFSIHYYVEGQTVYRAVPEKFLAFHVKEHRKAAASGYSTTVPGLSKPRGDILAIGIEHAMQPDGSWDEETRITSVLLGAEISRRRPLLEWSEHATWDPWTRANDVGKAVWIPDWIADVRDVVDGKEPHRTVGRRPGSSTSTPEETAVAAVPLTVDQRLERLEDQMATLSAGLARVENELR